VNFGQKRWMLRIWKSVDEIGRECVRMGDGVNLCLGVVILSLMGSRGNKHLREPILK
jgi:hypothetical protein